jgi:hypothetical protein
MAPPRFRPTIETPRFSRSDSPPLAMNRRFENDRRFFRKPVKLTRTQKEKRTLVLAPRYTASSSRSTKSGSFCCHSLVSVGFLCWNNRKLRVSVGDSGLY